MTNPIPSPSAPHDDGPCPKCHVHPDSAMSKWTSCIREDCPGATPPAPASAEALPVVAWQSEDFGASFISHVALKNNGKTSWSKQYTIALVHRDPAQAIITALQADNERLEALVSAWMDEDAKSRGKFHSAQAERDAAMIDNERLRGERDEAMREGDSMFESSAKLIAELDALKAAAAPGADRLDVEAATDLAALRAFAGEVMGDWPDVGGLDGFDLQGIGEKTGLLRRETRQAPCGDQCACVEFESGEVECWRVEPVLQRARETLREALGAGGLKL